MEAEIVKALSPTYRESFYAVIGLGGAGGAVSSQLVSKLKREGVGNVKLFLFNTSSIDMEGLGADQYYILGDPAIGPDGKKRYEGSGKDREKGKAIAQKEEAEIRKIFEDLKANADLTAIFLNFSSGGGTGSGMSTVFTDIIKDIFGKSTPIFVNMIKPFEFETIPNVNSINNIMEFSGMLAKKELIFNLIDNNVISERLNSTDFNDINREIVDSQLLFFYDYLEKHSKPASSFSLDKNDFHRILHQKGGTAGLISVYGYKDGKFYHMFNHAGIKNEAFEGARKVLCVVKNSKLMGEMQKAVKKAGNSNVLEFKSIEFDNNLVGNQGFSGLVYSIGEPKSDNIVDEMVEKFQESQAMKTEMAKKDEIKSTIKEKNLKKVKLNF